MKKLFFAVYALAALSLLAPSVGFAQAPAWNQLGIYADTAGSPGSANAVAAANLPFFAYVVLTNPVNETFNNEPNTSVPITSIDGFECKITIPPVVFVLGVTYPKPMINIGADGNYYVGYSESVPVVGTSVVLATIQMLVGTTDAYNVFMDNADIMSIDGTMAIVDGNETIGSNLQSVYRSTNDPGVPVFTINGDAAVATEAQTFGGVKSLFR